MARTAPELRTAVKNRDPELAAKALAQIDRLDGSFSRQAEALLEWAVSEDHLELVRAALARGAAANPREGRVPLLAVATSVPMARLLIEHGADIRATWMPTRNEGRPANVLHYLQSNLEHAELKRYFTELMGLIDPEELAAVEPMPEQEFWLLVEKALRAGRDDSTLQAREVVSHLRRRPLADIVAFQRRFDERAARLLSAELWAFYFLVDGGCSDDVFLFDVPSRVIALGRDVYEAAVEDPDSLLRHVGRNRTRYVNYSAIECPRLGAAAEVAWRMATGHDDFARHVGVKPGPSRPLAWDPHDEEWLARKLPRTWKAARE